MRRFTPCLLRMVLLVIPMLAVPHSQARANPFGERDIMTHPLKLLCKPSGRFVEITVAGMGTKPVEVEYELTVSGNSTTRHKGKTRLNGAVDEVISKVSIAASANWSATLRVQQSDGAAYTLRQDSQKGCV